MHIWLFKRHVYLTQTQAAKILSIPLIVSEQYPEKLGSTVAQIDISHAKFVVAKKHFSMLPAPIRPADANSEPSNLPLYNVFAYLGNWMGNCRPDAATRNSTDDRAALEAKARERSLEGVPQIVVFGIEVSFGSVMT